MKSLAIGDSFIGAKHFDEYFKSSSLFEAYESYSFNEDLDRNSARKMVRDMEIMGPDYCEIPDKVYQLIADKDVLAVHLFPVPRKLMEKAPKLKYILTARGGLENIDVAFAKERGITIINCPGHNAYAVAEFTIGMMIAEMRNIARADSALRDGVWREKFPNSNRIPELRGCTVGIIGFGTIGRLVAERLVAFGSKLMIYDPYVKAEDIRALGYTPAELMTLVSQSDVITLHGRLAEGEPPVIGKTQLEAMKPTAVLINSARAALVDNDALAEALKNNKIMGAAIDVFPTEPLPENYPFIEIDNVLLTNHRAGDTIDSYIKAPEMILEQFNELLTTGYTRCMVR